MRKRSKLQLWFNRQNAIALVVVVLSLLAFWWLQRAELNLFTPSGLKQVINSAGPVGPLIYISILALSVVICQIPGLPLAMAAGMIWGPVVAGIYSVVGAFTGAMIAYFLGRTLGRSTLKALLGKVIYFSSQRGEVYLGWLIFITRLLPVLPFDLISYGAGVAGVPLPVYSTATLSGMIPPTFLLTYLGSVFTVDRWLGIIFAVIFLTVLLGLPWVIQRHNWLGLKDVVHVE